MKWMVLTILVWIVYPVIGQNIIHREQSLYHTIFVIEEDGERCLKFSLTKKRRGQSCIDLGNPSRLLFSYTKMATAGLLLNPDPKRILVIGLGAGTLPTLFSDVYPNAQIVAVEIDAAVVRVAKTHFSFVVQPNMEIQKQDARVFVRRAVQREDQFDVIVLDAFTGVYVPEHLMTMEFLEDLSVLLGESGVLISNTFSRGRLYDHESATYAAVFGEFFNLKRFGSGNRIVIATESKLPSKRILRKRAVQLHRRLRSYGVDVRSYVSGMSRSVDWNEFARPLTDDYMPANLFQEL